MILVWQRNRPNIHYYWKTKAKWIMFFYILKERLAEKRSENQLRQNRETNPNVSATSSATNSTRFSIENESVLIAFVINAHFFSGKTVNILCTRIVFLCCKMRHDENPKNVHIYRKFLIYNVLMKLAFGFLFWIARAPTVHQALCYIRI